MGILDQFQKLDDLIVEKTEPPVRTVLRNQLALTREQVEAYQSSSDRQDETLARQAETIAALQKHNQELVAKYEKQDSPVPQLDDTATKILQTVAGAPNGALKDSLVARFGLSVGRGDFVFEQLSGHKLIEVRSFNMGGGGSLTYHATRKCREYLSERGLL